MVTRDTQLTDAEGIFTGHLIFLQIKKVTGENEKRTKATVNRS